MENNSSFQAAPARPVGQLKTNRGLFKYIIFSILTFGIYSLVFMSSISSYVNVVCSRYDGKKTMHYCLLFFRDEFLASHAAIIAGSPTEDSHNPGFELTVVFHPHLVEHMLRTLGIALWYGLVKLVALSVCLE